MIDAIPRSKAERIAWYVHHFGHFKDQRRLVSVAANPTR